MYKKICTLYIIVLGLTACTQTQSEPKPEVQTAVKIPVKNENLNSESQEFIPEHIRRSHIEVVPHN